VRAVIVSCECAHQHARTHAQVFSHFDKDKDQTLRSYELKACLNSLGDDCPDDEIKRLLTT
jgi:Ca2+-binding EF-hand superfamily protein